MSRNGAKQLRNFCLVSVILLIGADGRADLCAEVLRSDRAELKYEEPKYLSGTIYAVGTKELLFRFKRVAIRTDSILKVERDFSYPDGRLAARERVVYEGDALVSYELDERQIGASGTARIQRMGRTGTKDTIEFVYRPAAGGRPKQDSEDLRDPALIADMVGPFLVSHWDRLVRGEKVKCRYIVIPRMETVGFTFVRDAELSQREQNGLIIKMEPSSPFLSALVEPLFFTIDATPPHRVLSYVGRTTPKIRVGDKWKDLDALTVFDWKSAQ